MTPTTQQAADPKAQLIAQFGETFQKLLEEQVDDEANFEKLLQYLRLRKADYYFRGIQYIAPQLSPTGVIDYTPVGSPVVGAEGSRGIWDYNIDQIKTYGRKFIATLGQRPFYNVKAVPDDPQSEDDRNASREADKAVILLRSWWNVKIKNLEMAYHAWKSGTIFPYVRYVVDSNKYGFSEEPLFEVGKVVVEAGGYACMNCGAKSPELSTLETLDASGNPMVDLVCPQCQHPIDPNAYEPPVEADVPVDSGRTQKYPNGQVELHFYSGFFATTTFQSVDIEDVPWFKLEGEEHIGRLIAIYPSLREKMKSGELNVAPDGGATHQSGMQARASSQSQTGSYRQPKSMITWTRLWLRPFMLELIKDDTKREEAKQQFPDGIKVVRVGKDVVDLVAEKLDDHISAVYPEVGEYIFRDGICWGILQHQDAINDTLNQMCQLVERANTKTLVWASVIDVDALNDRPNMPAEMLSVPDGTDFQRSIHTMQNPTFPKEGTQLLDILKQNIESHSGVLPNVFGAGGPTQTAEQSRNELNQALMQLGTTGEFFIDGWINIHTMGIWELARNAPKNMKVPMSGRKSETPGAGAEVIDFDLLKSGHWHLEGEMGIPRSYAERKDELKSLIGQNPELAHAMQVDAPINSGAVRDYLDLPDLQDPADDVRQFIHEVINELLQGQPIQPPPPPPPMDPAMPPPPPAAPMPSSTRLLDAIDAGFVDAAAAAELIREWFAQSGRNLQNTPGFANVVATMKQLQQMLMPPPGMPADPNAPAGAAPAGPPPMGGPPKAKAPKPPNPKGPPTPTGQAPLPTGAAGPMAA